MAEKPIRVLHVLGRMNPGGVETWLMHVLRHIDRQKFQMDFCTLSGQPGTHDPEIEALSSKVIPRRLGRNPLSFARRFRCLLREGAYDVVHSHVHHFSGAILRWAHAERVPIRIAHSHTTSDGKRASLRRRLYRRWMKAWIWKHATHGLACSKDAIRPFFGSAAPLDKRFGVFYLGIDLQPFRVRVDRNEVRRESEIPEGVPVVGHVGRFAEPKNHAFILRMADQIRRIRPEVHFLLIGDGPLRSEIEAQARGLRLSDSVHFAGRVPDVPRLMRACMDAFVLPSLWEGLPITLIEVQAAGLRCLVSDTVNREVAVLPDSLQYLPLSAGPSEWAARLLQALDRGRISSEIAFKSVAESDFCIERSLSTLREIYCRASQDQARWVQTHSV